MLLKAIGGFGLLAGAAVVLSDDGESPRSGAAGEQDRPVAPRVRLAFDYDATDGTLEIIHDGGDPIRVDELFVRIDDGQSGGAWGALGGSASGQMDGVAAVVGGDTVTAAVQPTYAVRVVWRSSEGDVSSELARDVGPEA